MNMWSRFLLLWLLNIPQSSGDHVCIGTKCSFSWSCDYPQCGKHVILCSKNAEKCEIDCGEWGCQDSVIISAAQNTTIICHGESSCQDMTVFCGANFNNNYQFANNIEMKNISQRISNFDILVNANWDSNQLCTMSCSNSHACDSVIYGCIGDDIENCTLKTDITSEDHILPINNSVFICDTGYTENSDDNAGAHVETNDDNSYGQCTAKCYFEDDCGINYFDWYNSIDSCVCHGNDCTQWIYRNMSKYDNFGNDNSTSLDTDNDDSDNNDNNDDSDQDYTGMTMTMTHSKTDTKTESETETVIDTPITITNEDTDNESFNQDTSETTLNDKNGTNASIDTGNDSGNSSNDTVGTVMILIAIILVLLIIIVLLVHCIRAYYNKHYSKLSNTLNVPFLLDKEGSPKYDRMTDNENNNDKDIDLIENSKNKSKSPFSGIINIFDKIRNQNSNNNNKSQKLTSEKQYVPLAVAQKIVIPKSQLIVSPKNGAQESPQSPHSYMNQHNNNNIDSKSIKPAIELRAASHSQSTQTQIEGLARSVSFKPVNGDNHHHFHNNNYHHNNNNNNNLKLEPSGQISASPTDVSEGKYALNLRGAGSVSPKLKLIDNNNNNNHDNDDNTKGGHGNNNNVRGMSIFSPQIEGPRQNENDENNEKNYENQKHITNDKNENNKDKGKNENTKQGTKQGANIDIVIDKLINIDNNGGKNDDNEKDNDNDITTRDSDLSITDLLMGKKTTDGGDSETDGLYENPTNQDTPENN